MRFSTHDPAKLGQKFVDEPELWKKTEEMTRNVLKSSGINYVEVPTKRRFTGRRSTCRSGARSDASSPSQPIRSISPSHGGFDLVYKDRDNTEKTPLCIHRAPLGTHERFIGFLIEHYAGQLPALALARAGSHPDRSAMNRRCRLCASIHATNFAHIKSAPNSI